LSTATAHREQAASQVLPTPPTDEENLSYLERNRGYLAAALYTASLSILFCQLGFEIFASPWLFPVTILMLLQLASATVVMFAGSDFSLADHEMVTCLRQAVLYPSVDIFLPIAGEPIRVLRNTWGHVTLAAHDYPGEARVYVLDDGRNDQAREMAGEFGFNYVRRPDWPRMRKSGNLNYAFGHTKGELIAVFDADFTPRRDYLLETVPYFDDPQLGVLQTPQFFRCDRRQTWVERAGNVVQEIFYRNIQVARDALRGSAVCCGTCAVYRRAALGGGFAEFPYAEDEHTGLRVRRNGYAVKYIPVALATGISPATVDAFARQQYRWTSGTFSTMRLWPRDKGLRVFIAYASGMFYYIYSASMVFAGPAVPVAMLLFWPQHVHLYNYFALSPALIAGFVLYPLWHKSEFGPSAWPLSLVRGWVHFLAIVDYVTGRTMGWQVTGGNVGPVKRLWLGLGLWSGGMAALWVSLAVYRTVQTGSDRFGLIGLLGLFYTGLVIFIIASDDNPVRKFARRVFRRKAAVASLVASGLIAGCSPLAWVPAAPVPARPVHARVSLTRPLVGVYEDGAPGSWAPVATFAAATHARLTVAGYYSGWWVPFNTRFAAAAWAHGAYTFVQLSPTDISCAKIAAGGYDSYLTAYADAVRAFRHPVIIAFGHEVNGNWYSWGEKTPARDYVAAWRHIVTLFRKQGADNVTWTWVVNIGRLSLIKSRYPGAGYIDWIGVTGYYTSQSSTFANVLAPTVSYMRKLAPGKPVLVDETGIEPGGTRPAQILNLFNGIRSDHLLGLIYFDYHQYGRPPARMHQDWRLEGDQAALAAFKRGSHIISAVRG
jgi:cellulose synthase (UDP-forming)